MVSLDKVKGVKSGSLKFPGAALRVKSGVTKGATAIDENAIDKLAVPVSVVIEYDPLIPVRFPCKDGHYKFSVPPM